MKKRSLFLLLAIGITSISSADYLDDWPDEALCGWMDSPSPPSYMVEEVKKRGISCSGGVAIINLPDSLDLATNDLLINIGEGVAAVVPGYVSKEFTQESFQETWLSKSGLKPEDLSPMILELNQTTQVTQPACTTDFCFTTQEEYGGNGLRWGTDEKILNKGDLINALYRLSDKEYHGVQQRKSERCEEGNCVSIRSNNYCNESGCFPIRQKVVSMGDQESEWNKDVRKTGRYYVQGIFPDGAANNQSVYNPFDHTGSDVCDNCSKEGLTPNQWLYENGLTAEDVFNMLGNSPTTYRIDYRKKLSAGEGWIEEPSLCKDWGNGYGFRCNDAPKWGNTFEGTRDGECTKESVCFGEEIELEIMYAEITNTNQLMRSLLILNPNAFGPNLTYNWEDPDKIIVEEFLENIYELHPWKHPECFGPAGEIKESCRAYSIPFSQPIPDPPVVPAIRPGWKILEGTDMLVINDEDPYWQTEEGLIERPPKIDPGIEYAPETVPGADPKIVPDLPPEVDKPPSDPNPPPILDDPTVLQPVDPG